LRYGSTYYKPWNIRRWPVRFMLRPLFSLLLRESSYGVHCIGDCLSTISVMIVVANRSLATARNQTRSPSQLPVNSWPSCPTSYYKIRDLVFGSRIVLALGIRSTDLWVVGPVDSWWWLRAVLHDTREVNCAALVDIHVRLTDDDCDGLWMKETIRV
jgi:hypothetical protein